jgi:DNA-binding CsgD family transcriptional regulator
MPNAAPVQVAQQNIPIWTAYEAHAKTYREQVSQASPAWEFQMLLVQAQQQSRHDRTVLLARDGFDVAQWRWLSGYFPLTPAARTAHLMTRNHYETYARILRSGMLMLIIALQEQLPLIAAIQGAAQVMREEELKSIPLTLMWLGTQPHAIVQHWAQSALSGWITAQTWLSPSVRKALDAQQLSPARFFEFLGDEVRQAQQEGIDTPQALLTTVRRRIDALRQTGRPRGRPKKRDNTTAHPLDMDKADLQAWQTTEHAQRKLDRVPLHNISLGPKEKRIWELHLQGLKPKEIAEELGDVTAANVRTTLHNVRQKLTTGKRHRGKSG